jgi:2-C-methyl-D-erythritol 4-phosphate cytidylyltransferase
MRASAIVVAAGSGLRLGAGTPKAFLPFAGTTLLGATLRTIGAVPSIGEVVITVPAGMETRARHEVGAAGLEIPVKIVAGGAERQDSVRIALALTSAEAELIVVHDAARPLASVAMFEACLERAAAIGAAIVAVPVADTLKRVAKNDRAGGTEQGARQWSEAERSGESASCVQKNDSATRGQDKDQDIICATLPRAGLWQAQTPQAFRRRLILDAHARATQAGITATDDSDLVEQTGARVAVVPGSPTNLKITTADDLRFAEALAADRLR